VTISATVWNQSALIFLSPLAYPNPVEPEVFYLAPVLHFVIGGTQNDFAAKKVPHSQLLRRSNLWNQWSYGELPMAPRVQPVPTTALVERNGEEMRTSDTRTVALKSLEQRWENQGLISEALKRIENNSYGHCAECDAQISPRRLAAVPWAKYCFECQEFIDRAISGIRWDTAA
jgi:hypothetical protein